MIRLGSAEKRRIYVEGLLNGTLTIDDVAKLTGQNRDSIRKAWNHELLGGRAVSQMSLQGSRDDGIATRKLMRERTRRYQDIEYLAKLFEEHGSKTYPLITREEFRECECYSESTIVILSDLHIGQEYDNAIGIYNTEIAKERLNKLEQEILLDTDWGDEVNLFILGDIIDNIHLHRSIALEDRMNNIEQLKAVVDLLSNFIYHLYLSGLIINVYSCAGNHDRLNKKDEVLRNERFSELVMWILEREFKNNDFIKFIKNDEPTIVNANICGLKVIGVHGDMDSNFDKLIAYVGSDIDLILSGHLHTLSVQEINGITCIQNGALCGCGSDYCITKRLKGRPEQTIIKVRKGIGISEIHPVYF